MTNIVQPAAAPRSATLHSQPRKSFVATPTVRSLSERAMAFLSAGYPVHFRGPAGTGKTTLAFHVASQLGRPIMLITGDDEFGTSDLIGSQAGYHTRRVVDRYIHSVVKVEEDVSRKWVDQRLTTACVEGYTLIYDEFTRSRPSANNVLLGILEEHLMVLPTSERGEAYVKVHPDFRAIFTSNPAEYVGVHRAQDALSDRLVTLDVEGYDTVTEVAITVARSGLLVDDAVRIVNIVRKFRESGKYTETPTIRACVMIARVAAANSYTVSSRDERFVRLCLDVLSSKILLDRAHRQQWREDQEFLDALVRRRADPPTQPRDA